MDIRAMSIGSLTSSWSNQKPPKPCYCSGRNPPPPRPPSPDDRNNNNNKDKFSTDWDKAWSSFKKQGKKSLFSQFTPNKYVSWNPRRSNFPLSEEVDPIKRAERSNLSLWTSPGFTLGGAIVIVTFLLLDEIVNQGKLVSDEIILNLLSKRLEAGESRDESGFILDGPRTIRQAVSLFKPSKKISHFVYTNVNSNLLCIQEILDAVTEIVLVVNLKLREDVLIEKCLGRRICSECGKGFNVASINAEAEKGLPAMSIPPLLPPPQCASKLITRTDDPEPVVKERLDIYMEKSQPVEDYYRKQGELMEFDLPGGIQESWPKLLEALNLDDYNHTKSAVE